MNKEKKLHVNLDKKMLNYLAQNENEAINKYGTHVVYKMYNYAINELGYDYRDMSIDMQDIGRITHENEVKYLVNMNTDDLEKGIAFAICYNLKEDVFIKLEIESIINNSV